MGIPQMQDVLLINMISNEKCYEILRNNYTQEEAKEIKAFLTKLVDIIYESKSNNHE